jgi:hypothetical protein
MCVWHPGARERTSGPAFVSNVASIMVWKSLRSLQTTDPMAITLTLKDKYPDWTQEDWDRFRWINSWDRRRRNLAPLLPCKRCGTAAIFEENHEDMPYHNVFTLGCPKCHRYLETTTDLSPVQFWGRVWKSEMHLFDRTKSRATANDTTMELFQFSGSPTMQCYARPSALNFKAKQSQP